MAEPSARFQLEFLNRIQALLEGGLFPATYKLALLVALADLAVERGRDDERPLRIDVTDIAARFIEYYWQQAQPYAGPRAGHILLQSTGRQSAVVNALAWRRKDFKSLAALRSDHRAWNATVRSS